MQLRPDQLAAHLKQGLAPLYVVHGDEPLLALEAADAIRAAARDAGHTERQVHTVAGNYFDWSSLLGAASAMSLFADKQLVEIRIPSGKPGKDGSAALQQFCERLPEDTVTLVQLPKLDRQQLQGAWFLALEAVGVSIRVDPVERGKLPAWIAQRLAQQGQRVASGDEGQRTLAFFADRVEGHLLAAQQEIKKLALLYPEGELSFDQVEQSVGNVARYDVFKLGEAVLAGQVERITRMLDGLRAEGEAAVLVHWTLSEDIRALRRCKEAQGAGKPLPMVLREQRVWGAKERLFERALPLLDETRLEQLLEAAHVCDGLVKGLRHPDWPEDPWEGLRRLALLVAAPLVPPQQLGHARARLVLRA